MNQFRGAAGAIWGTVQAANRAKDSDNAELQEALKNYGALLYDARVASLAAAAATAGVRIPPDASNAATDA